MRDSTFAAIARVEVVDARGNSINRGTAFAISASHLMTAFHVVGSGGGNGASAPLIALGTIHVEFFPGTPNAALRYAEVVSGHAVNDWALLRIVDGGAVPAAVRPIRLADIRADQDHRFETHGFPDVAQVTGMGFSGDIHHPLKPFQESFCHELYAARATGVPVAGLSGAPIVVDGRAVGILRSYLGTRPDQHSRKEVIGGALYACPTSLFRVDLQQVALPNDQCDDL